jgi:hypothetical protein
MGLGLGLGLAFSAACTVEATWYGILRTCFGINCALGWRITWWKWTTGEGASQSLAPIQILR